jgi:hypothetical protein
MVPWWTFIALTAAFFIRDVYLRSKKNPNDYDSGYRQAIIDTAKLWNDDVKNGNIMAFSSSKLFKFHKENLKGR